MSPIWHPSLPPSPGHWWPPRAARPAQWPREGVTACSSPRGTQGPQPGAHAPCCTLRDRRRAAASSSVVIFAGFVIGASPGSAMACPLIKRLIQLTDCPLHREEQEGSETSPPRGGVFSVGDITWPLRGPCGFMSPGLREAIWVSNTARQKSQPWLSGAQDLLPSPSPGHCPPGNASAPDHRVHVNAHSCPHHLVRRNRNTAWLGIRREGCLPRTPSVSDSSQKPPVGGGPAPTPGGHAS